MRLRNTSVVAVRPVMVCRRALDLSWYVALSLGVAAFSRGTALAAPISPAFTYQGQVKDDGRPVNGTVDLTFDFFDVESGGVSLATQSFPGVAVANGLFSVVVNGPEQAEPAPLDGTVRWIEISVNGAPLSPRQPLTSAPYATLASKPWQIQGEHTFLPAGNVGLGTDSPAAMLHLRRDFADTAIRMQSSRFQEGAPAGEPGVPVAAASTGTGQAWSNPTNVFISDDGRASVGLAGSAGGTDFLESQFLDIADFGFSIPAQAVVVGISGTVEASANCNCPECDRCSRPISVEMLGGVGVSSQTSVAPTTSDESLPIGGMFETWGLEWTAAQVNSPNFGVRLRASLGLQELSFCFPAPLGCVYQACDCNGTGEAHVDAVTLTVHYYDVSATTTPLNWTVGLSQNDSHFRVAPTADMTTPAIVAMTTGSVGIAMVPQPFFVHPSLPPSYHRLDVNGTIRCQSVTTGSSRRFKEDVRPVDDAMDKVLALQGVKYRWDAEHGAQPDVGFIAEDVGRVIPEVVDYEADGTNAAGLRYDRLTVYAVEAIKQLHADLKMRDAEIAALRERIEQLEAATKESKPAAQSDVRGEP